MNEQDWRLFKERLPKWQEAYMERLNAGYIRLLTGEGTASEKFWTLEKRIRTDRSNPCMMMDMRRSMLKQNIITLLLHGFISMENLRGFSKELLDSIAMFTRHDASR